MVMVMVLVMVVVVMCQAIVMVIVVVDAITVMNRKREHGTTTVGREKYTQTEEKRTAGNRVGPLPQNNRPPGMR